MRFGPRTLLTAASTIIRGGLVAYPTDTVYGVGCDPLNVQAIQRLVRVKKRKTGQLPVLVDSVGRAAELGRFDLQTFQLAKKFWPGPLTIVVPTRTRFPTLITGPSHRIGLRVPNHDVAIELVRASGGALVGTSANLTGNRSLTDAEAVAGEFYQGVDLVLDDSESISGVETTVVSIDNGALSVLREKSIRKEAVLSAIRTSN